MVARQSAGRHLAGGRHWPSIGVYSFLHVNVEAYPDPAPPTVEVVALFPGASAEEVERQVTTPLEVALAGMPGLESMHSKTVFGLSDIKVLFDYGVDYKEARQETINRLQSMPPLPAGRHPADFARSRRRERFFVTCCGPPRMRAAGTSTRSTI